MIYLDTAALIKLVRPEAETEALADWLEQRPDVPLVASSLVEVELPRPLRRCAPELMGSVPAIMKRVGVYDIDEVVRATAAAYQDAMLRSLDAIHLATAHAIFGSHLVAFVTYDSRLHEAAEEIGLPVAQPGVG
ncbi:type II toxin-antitoxin system VapC family toxin [Saccharopolyspora halophila]|uniref:Ribonuclease VapC n=1 Tax=Saccharopolyspora halophila TaxID=405551 RepID=A0ABN3FZA5_9PSEU